MLSRLPCPAARRPPTTGSSRHSSRESGPFPRDHGRHDGFRTEWWYFTGKNRTSDHRPFGFELTFFRTSVTPSAPRRASRWAARDLYFAHAHVADIQSQRYVIADERSRAREGLAIASDRGLNVVCSTSVRAAGQRRHHPPPRTGDDGASPLIARSIAGRSFRALVASVERAVRSGSISYYSLTRLRTKGTLPFRPVVCRRGFKLDGSRIFQQPTLQRPGRLGLDVPPTRQRHRSDDLPDANAAGKSDFAFATEVSPDGRTRYISGSDIDLRGSNSWKSPPPAATIRRSGK